jgi:hypothetical protein
LRTIAFFLLFFIFFFEIVRNFLEVLPGHGWSENRIPNKSDPDPDPKPDPIPSPKLSAACWSENRTIVRNFDQDAAASGDLCCAGCCFPGLQLPNTEQLFGFLTREAR